MEKQAWEPKAVDLPLFFSDDDCLTPLAYRACAAAFRVNWAR
jgi:hypothetical protein